MIERAKELLGYYYWVRLEGIVALWYCESDNPLINRIIDVMTEWSFNLKYHEETGKVLEENKNIDMESGMIVDFFSYMIHEAGHGKSKEVVTVFSPYLSEDENVILCELYETINKRENELRELYHSEDELIKQAALDEFMLPSIRFKKEEIAIPMRELLFALLEENLE
ncbi:MAG: hypothetical protein GX306_09475 [Clostridiales bacterium]|jgi:hypothetical protein|nr:hypothetical protein [Clostridiales bacterium]